MTICSVADKGKGLFGMNFFDFDDATYLLRISPNFWIYVVLTVPMMVLTIACWQIVAYRQKKQRGRIDSVV